ncbi:serine hydrolase domain-containing protein [Agrococcus sp. ProA11]|uniref:serine hydrolase domain-containing protein n=1 Tax=Agrococcus chionoecetis TaxID=3153752 RepID=UPI00326175CE
MLMRPLLIAGLLLGVVTSPLAEAEATVERVIDQEMAASGVPGLAYAIVDDGAVRSVGARGVVEAGTEVAVTPDTPFVIGSISKSFTALAVMQLVEAEALGLEDEISAHLDVFEGSPAATVTIRQLLDHTSGYSTLQGNPSRAPGVGADALARRVQWDADRSPAYPPGERWEYSNTNYEILGHLIEEASGQSYGSYIEEHILRPIGMEHSFVSDGAVHKEMAVGHTPWFWAKLPVRDRSTSPATAPQGGIVASASDLARYLNLLMNGEDDILSAEGKTLLMRPSGGASSFYGLGWFIDAANGTVSHSGSTPGVETLATMVPAQRTGAVVLVNGGSGMGFGETARLREGIIAAALGVEPPGSGSRWSQQLLFVGLVALPIAYAASAIWAWRHRAALRAKRQAAPGAGARAFGLFSLWFPLATTVAAAWVMLQLVPTLFGAPISVLLRFQPDVGAAMIAAAVTGVLWASFRLAVAYGDARAAPVPHVRDRPTLSHVPG